MKLPNLSANQKIVAGLVVLAGGYLVYRYVAAKAPALPKGSGAPSSAPSGAPLPSGEAKTPEQIKVLQSALNKLPAGPKLVVDGIYGPNTAAAVRAFQASAGLPQSGVADMATIVAMRAKLKALGVYDDTSVNA